jgi:hypothetical protein
MLPDPRLWSHHHHDLVSRRRHSDSSVGRFSSVRQSERPLKIIQLAVSVRLPSTRRDRFRRITVGASDSRVVGMALLILLSCRFLSVRA